MFFIHCADTMSTDHVVWQYVVKLRNVCHDRLLVGISCLEICEGTEIKHLDCDDSSPNDRPNASNRKYPTRGLLAGKFHLTND